MSYVINKTDGSVLSTPTMPSGVLTDGTIDTSTGLSLIGRNYPNYGDAQNENFVRLLENFADNVPPTSSVTALNALVGTLWYDTSAGKVRVYDGTNWNTINGTIVANAAPTTVTYTLTAGDQWYDSVNSQLNLWNGTVWVLIGPQHTAAQALSGTYVEEIVDTTGTPHVVVTAYAGEIVISITSVDAEFTPAATYTKYANFSTIKPGVNVPTGKVFNGRAENSIRLDGLYANVFARTDTNNTFTQNITLNKNLSFNNANLYYGSQGLVIQNSNYLGTLDVYLNTTVGNVNVLSFDSTTGLGSVYGAPTTTNGIATKGYVDAGLASASSSLSLVDAAWQAGLSKLRLDTGNYMTANVGSINNTIASVQSSINSNVNSLSDSTNARLLYGNAVAASQQVSINSINAALPTYAPLASPTLTGSPRVPTAAPLTRSTIAASTAYVDLADDVLRADYTALVAAERAARIAGITNGTDGFALVDSQTFVGTPRVPTPGPTDNSTRIASTAFVQTSISGLAPINNPSFTGTPWAPTASLNTNSTVIATTEYSDRADGLLQADYLNRIATEVTDRNAAIATATSLLAPKLSPALTGNPTAPTQVSSDNSTKLATTSFVHNITDLLAPKASPTFTGTPMVPTAAANTSNQIIASTEYSDRADTTLRADYISRIATEVTDRNAAISAAVTPLAPKASPAFTGTPTAPTQAIADKSTKLATTAFVHSVLPAGAIIMWGGSVASIPSGWVLCNGLNGTPDLRDRFIVGAGSSYTPGATGGSASATITDVPAHSHSLGLSGATDSSGAHSHSASSTSSSTSSSLSTSSVSDPGHSHTTTFIRDQASGTAGNAVLGDELRDGYQVETSSVNKTGISVSTTTSTSTNTSTSTIIGSSGAHSHSVSITGSIGTTGTPGGVTVPTRPPYYALCYIQKVN